MLKIIIKTPSTGAAAHTKEAEPKGCQGIHPTPLTMYIVPRLPYKKGGAQGTPGHTSDSLAVYIVPYLPCKIYIIPRLPRKKGGTQGTPGRISDPSQIFIVPFLPRKIYIIPRLPRKRGGSQGTPGRASDPLALHIVPRLPCKRAGAQATPGCHAKCTLSHACRAKKAKPKERQGIYPTLGNAHYPTPATQKRRSPRNARAYIQPPSYWTLSYALTLDIVPRLPRKRGGAQGTSGRISDLGNAYYPTPAT